MAFDFLLNENSDLVIQNKDIALTDSPRDLLKQKILITFRTMTGEWYLNTRFGAYDKNIFLNKAVTKDGIDAYLISILLGFDEVEDIIFFTSTVDNVNRAYSCNFAVRSIAGNGTFSVNILPPGTEATYPESGLGLTGVCSTTDSESANEFYELMNIRIPTEIPWD